MSRSANHFFTGAGSGPANYIEDVFSTYLYTANGSTGQTITNGIDLLGKGGLVWVKDTVQTYEHVWWDTVRGTDVVIRSDSIQGNATRTGSITYNNNGFRLNSATGNESTDKTVSWTFRKQPKFFDIQTFTYPSSGSITVPHNLGSTPGCVMVKATDGADNWYVYHRMANNGTNPSNYILQLNTSSAQINNFASWITVGSSSITFPSGALNPGSNFVMYLFAHDAGGFGESGNDNVISCGSYTGNGSATGPTVSLGYEPQWLLLKSASAGSSWCLFDNMRGVATGGSDALLLPNLSNTESLGSYLDFNATGFNLTTSGTTFNGDGTTYIYIAIRRGPMKVPTSGTSVFAPVLTTNDSAWTAGFPVDMFIEKWRADTTDGNYNSSRLTGGRLRTQDTEAEVSPGAWGFFASNTQAGAVGNYGNLGQSIITHNFRRAPSFFDVVCYTGTGTNNRQITHNLGVAPELIINKNRGANWPWWVGGSVLGSTRSGMFLNTTQAIQNNPQPNAFSTDGAAFTSSYFLVSSVSAYPPNANGYANIAYLFATLAGVSKVGSYTGTGTTLQVNCGFTAGARFVLIKRTDSTGDWYVWDSARGIVAGNDPYLLLNSIAAEVTNTDYIDSYSPGFELSSTAPAAINANGGTYIFLAIA